MANVGFSISPAPGVTNDFIAVIYDTNASAAEIDRLPPIPAPHASPQNLLFSNLQPGTYIVKIHETPDGTTLGNLHHDFWVDATLQKLLAYEVKTFQVDLGRGTPYFDPADGDSNYINTDLDGLTYTVFKPGYGPLDWDANITPYAGGGFSFTDGQKFSHDEIYTILISNLVTQPVSQSGGSGYPDGVVQITGDIFFVSTHYKKLLEVSGFVNITISFGDLSTIPDNTVFGINTQTILDTDPDSDFRYAILDLPFGKYAMIHGEAKNRVFVGRGEEMAFIKKGNYLRLVNGGEGYRRVGEIVYAFGKPPINSLPLTGGWRLKSAFPRIFEDYVNALDPAELGTGTDDVEPDADNRTKWIIGLTKFWTPDHGGLSHRGTDPDGNNDSVRLPGAYQADAVGPASVRTTAWTGNGIGKNSVSSTSVGFLATLGDGGTINSDSATGTNNNAARTVTFSVISPAGQTRARNVAQNFYVII